MFDRPGAFTNDLHFLSEDASETPILSRKCSRVPFIRDVKVSILREVFQIQSDRLAPQMTKNGRPIGIGKEWIDV
jgi:hypothetical protein